LKRFRRNQPGRFETFSPPRNGTAGTIYYAFETNHKGAKDAFTTWQKADFSLAFFSEFF